MIDVEVVKKEVDEDPYFAKVLGNLNDDPDIVEKFHLQHEALYYKNKLVLARSSSLIPAILQMYHNSVVGGHSGFLRTYKRLQESCTGLG